MGKVLVTGGCGYIGSHTLISLIDNGYDVVSVDSLINADVKVLEGIKNITGKSVFNYEIDLCNKEKIGKIFTDHPDISAVIHFAALKAVGESVENPGLYYKNNIESTANILDACVHYNCKTFIFSSSCTVYGNPTELPVTENSPIAEPTSPYGRTKIIGEILVEETSKISNIAGISLRYFNPAGAHHSAIIGESPTNPALNLVPIITETAIGKRAEMTVFGDDYPTRDGTNIRDYIHVMDVADAHVKAIAYLKNNPSITYDTFNLGIGMGISVFEAIEAFEKASGRELNFKIGKRRPGDAIAIYSDYTKAKLKLQWKPNYSIDQIMKSAWDWEVERSKPN